jgi:rod shape-determining protein MreC
LFLAVVLAQIILISAQVNSHAGVPVLEQVTFGVFSQIQRAMSSVVSGVRHGWSGYVGLRGVRAENETLKRDLASAQIQLQAQRALADRSRGLEQLLQLRDRSNLSTTAAEIIADSPTPDFRTMTIDKGTGDGLRADMAVIAAAGVVGRVVVPSTRAAKVQLLIDRNAAAGALIERSRAQGVVVGEGDYRLRMDYVSEVSDVVVGDLVVTSGIDGIFPKGFVIGQIETVEKNGGAYKRIVVRPAVDFRGLEDVLVVLTPTPAHVAGQAPAPALAEKPAPGGPGVGE